MTYSGSGNNRPTKNDRRDAARDKARALREQQRKKERRNRFLWQGGIGVAVIAIALVVVFVVIGSATPAGPGPTNMASDGITIGKDFKAVRTPAIPANGKPTPTVRDKKSSVVNIRIYLDYFCPICNEFENANKTQITSWLKTGAATIEIHPISFLDRSSEGTQYSTRAANAAGCVATYSPDQYWAFTQLMYTNQPVEDTPGLTDAQILAKIKSAKAKNYSEIASCVTSHRYFGWVGSATTRAEDGPLPDSNVKTVTGTPTVLVDGQQYVITDASVSSAADFAAFVEQVAGSQFNATTTPSTPTPTPTPTHTKKG
jgi:protein-disulfide isomerase